MRKWTTWPPFKNFTSNKKSDSVSRCVYLREEHWRTFLSNSSRSDLKRNGAFLLDPTRATSSDIRLVSSWYNKRRIFFRAKIKYRLIAWNLQEMVARRQICTEYINSYLHKIARIRGNEEKCWNCSGELMSNVRANPKWEGCCRPIGLFWPNSGHASMIPWPNPTHISHDRPASLYN